MLMQPQKLLHKVPLGDLYSLFTLCQWKILVEKRKRKKRLEFESFRARKTDRNLAVETRVLSTDVEAVPLVKFIYLVFTRIPGERYRKGQRSQENCFNVSFIPRNSEGQSHKTKSQDSHINCCIRYLLEIYTLALLCVNEIYWDKKRKKVGLWEFPCEKSRQKLSCGDTCIVHWRRGYTAGEVCLPCIYSHTRWEVP